MEFGSIPITVGTFLFFKFQLLMEQMSVSLIFDVSQNDSIMVFKYKDE